eukprot:superscaffoldBa00010546_g24769
MNIITVMGCDYALFIYDSPSFKRAELGLNLFGKHRKDERPGEKMDRKGSSKWRPEETQVSEEETMKMRMEQE